MRLLSRLTRFISLGVHFPMNVFLYARYVLLQRPWNHIQIIAASSAQKKNNSRPLRGRALPLSITLSDAELSAGAESACKHVFNLLGSGDTYVGDPIDWSASALDQGRGGIKYPWELSRFYHAPILAEAFVRTNNTVYLNELTHQIAHWIATNKIGSNPNWTNAMELAIRACNWCLALDILAEQQEYKKDIEFIRKVTHSLEEHGKFILRNLEYTPVLTNHYLADCVGLVYLGVFFEGTPLGDLFLNKGVVGIEECMARQVYDDGVDFESSIPYHRLCAELFGYAALVCRSHGEKLSGTYWEKLGRMFEFANQYMKPGGRAPAIGDCDNGRLHILSQPINSWDVADHRHLQILAKELWPARETEKQKSVLFPNGRIAIMRSTSFYCLVDAGGNGQDGNGGHCHNDILSFELALQGVDIIVDPGTGVYTSDPDTRNLFRSTRMHTTVRIDEAEQNRIPNTHEGIFWMHNDAQTRIDEWESHDTHDRLRAWHTGYARLANPVIHSREFFLEKDVETLRIRDSFQGNGAHTFEWNFHLHPNVELDRASDCSITLKTSACAAVLSFDPRLSLVVCETPFSPSYGIIVPSPSLRFAWNGSLPTEQFTFQFSML